MSRGVGAHFQTKTPTSHPSILTHYGQCLGLPHPRPPSQQQHQQPPHRKQYATTPRMQRRPGPLSQSTGSSQQAALLFPHFTTPPISWWNSIEAMGKLGGVPPAECSNAVTVFCSLATAANDGWKEKLEKDYKIPPLTLHYAALSLFLMNTPTPAAQPVGMRMLQTASTLNFVPSTLSLIRAFEMSPASARSKSDAYLTAVDQRFRRLLQTNPSPDVYTLQGLVLFNRGYPDAQALRFFDLALREGMEHPPPPPIVPGTGAVSASEPRRRSPRWTYEAICHRHRATLLFRRKERVEEARAEAFASLEVLAFELGDPKGYTQLAKRLLPAFTGESDGFLTRAAQSGDWEACELLAMVLSKLSGSKEAASELTKAKMEEMLRMAVEWVAVIPDEGKRADVLKRVKSVRELL
ncbi:uncharacterized protein C8A04DRAFT_9848 [Dichotomopilus funicola]|uniref:Uncharacterized protein n=1 Tax=Dichotomopilus funicola TaxID=1934379 RepID=A0AAN6ZQI2_9PEZI|nr:hypothetical protein C8A04DRAFT_9848 [Dichotomopilus funicola]